MIYADSTFIACDKFKIFEHDRQLWWIIMKIMIQIAFIIPHGFMRYHLVLSLCMYQDFANVNDGVFSASKKCS